MYDFKSNLIIGYHGCDASVRDQFLLKPNNFKISQKPFDWLGHGLYFWENNYERALQWALLKQQRGSIKQPAVIGAVLQLEYCCNLLETKFIELLSAYYSMMKEIYYQSGKEIPRNMNVPHDIYRNKLLRNLDCAVIEFMHAQLASRITKDIFNNGTSSFKAFDSTRGAFIEGGQHSKVRESLIKHIFRFAYATPIVSLVSFNAGRK